MSLRSMLGLKTKTIRQPRYVASDMLGLKTGTKEASSLCRLRHARRVRPPLAAKGAPQGGAMSGLFPEGASRKFPTPKLVTNYHPRICSASLVALLPLRSVLRPSTAQHRYTPFDAMLSRRRDVMAQNGPCEVLGLQTTPRRTLG